MNGITDGFGPEFVLSVYEVVATIPKGKVATYGQVAEKAGIPGAAQDVGNIMSRVQEGTDLPCHRVIRKTGELAPDFAFGGQARQRAMLEEEGIRFTDDGRVNMMLHQWGEHEQRTLF